MCPLGTVPSWARLARSSRSTVNWLWNLSCILGYFFQAKSIHEVPLEAICDLALSQLLVLLILASVALRRTGLFVLASVAWRQVAPAVLASVARRRISLACFHHTQSSRDCTQEG